MNDTNYLINKYRFPLLDLDEEFKYIKNTKGFFISNRGRVFKEPHIGKDGKFIKGKFINRNYNRNSEAYRYRIEYNNGDLQYHNACLLVGEYFVPNPDHFKYIKFKDGDPSNVDVDNLEWSSDSGIKRIRAFKKKIPYYDHPVWVEELAGLWQLWDTLEDAAKFYCVNITDILDILNNEEKTGVMIGISQFSENIPVKFSFKIPEISKDTPIANYYKNKILQK